MLPAPSRFPQVFAALSTLWPPSQKYLRHRNFLSDLAAPLAELPLHLIGHSRGGSLVGELASQTFSHAFQIDVAANPLPWQNASIRLDVNNDCFISPIDALTIINELDDRTWIDAIGRVPAAFDPSAFFYDVTGDGFVVPLDVLHVINHVNEQIVAQPENVLYIQEYRFWVLQ